MAELLDLPIRWLSAKLFCFRPVIRKEGDLLCARTDWRSHVFSFGFGSRRLTVDPQQKVLRMQIRRFWFAQTSRRIEFDWIEEILYGYNDMSAGWGAYQENDLFTVELQLKNGERVMLFRFFGEGDFVNNTIWPDWMYWSDALVARYARGDQERTSLLFVDLLSRMIGVPISNP